MAEIKTKILLRNDETANWESSSLVLSKGEAAVEFTEDSKAKIKIGDGNSTFNALPYVGGDETQVYDSCVEDANPGDFAIVKTEIATNLYSHTAYVYNGEKWEALDGNYDATNTYLKNNITLTSAVGNYDKGATIAAGTSIENVLSGLLQKEDQPDITFPSASISVAGGTDEVGATYAAPTASLSVSVGSYQYEPKATGVVFNAGDVSLTCGDETNTNSANVSTNGVAVTLTAAGGTQKYADAKKTYTFSGKAAYQASPNKPVTNLGNPSTKDPIPAGNCSVANKSVSFEGWRRMFMGPVAKDAELNSATIKSITSSTGINEKAVKSSAKTFTASVGTEKIIIAFPKNISKAAPKVEYFTMSWESFGDFSLGADNVAVADAAGVLTTDDNYKYMVYVYTPADPLKADTQFRVTLQ